MGNILLVEDDSNLIDGLEYSFRKNGFNVDVARTVRDFRYFSSIKNPADRFKNVQRNLAGGECEPGNRSEIHG